MDPSVRKFSLLHNCFFQNDKDPKHFSKIVREWLLYRTPKPICNTLKSPDFNSIGHLLDYIGKKKNKVK